jgi:Ran GTPase-activating protein (RanGAP) involved in mRNA processing and transport
MISKVELLNTDAASKSNYTSELFKMLPNLNTIDNKDKEGNEVESTLYDEEGDEFDDEDVEDEDFDEEDDFEDEDDEEFDEEDEEEEEKPKKKTKRE